MDTPSPRQACLQALRDWEEGDRFAEDILADISNKAGLNLKDRAFLNAITLGILRNLSLLDFWIDHLRKGRINRDLRRILRIGLYQILLMRVPDHAAVNETVGLSKYSRSMINAILRRTLREEKELAELSRRQDISVQLSHPRFLLDRWIEQFGEEKALAICEWNNRPAQNYVRVNLLHEGAQSLVEKDSSLTPVNEFPGFYRADQLNPRWFREGTAYAQDPSTSFAPKMLGTHSEAVVVDACAAPGGKAILLAQIMGNQGVIYACDSKSRRLATLRQNLRTYGVTNVKTFQHDWLQEPQATMPPWYPEQCDKLILDVPCSNTGVMRRRVDVRWRLTPESFCEAQATQLALFRRCLPTVKRGGDIVYSTCSLEAQENREVVNTIISEHEGLTLADEKRVLPFADGIDGAYAALILKR